MARHTIKDIDTIAKYNGAAVVHQTMFDADSHYLGSLCRRGHDFMGSGFSVRYRSMEGCVRCLVESGVSQRKQAAALKRAMLEQIPDGNKRCPKCKTIKVLSEFHSHKSTNLGVSSYCKPCTSEISKVNRAKHAERYRQRMANRRRIDWAENLYRGSRSSARVRGIEHAITKLDIMDRWEEQGGCCYWFGFQLGNASLPNRHPLKPSIDRKDPSKGYTPDNIVISSTFANLGRSDTSEVEFSRFVRSLMAFASENHTKLAAAFARHSTA